MAGAGSVGYPDGNPFEDRFQTSNLMSGTYKKNSFDPEEQRKKVVDLSFGPPGGPPRATKYNSKARIGGMNRNDDLSGLNNLGGGGFGHKP